MVDSILVVAFFSIFLFPSFLLFFFSTETFKREVSCEKKKFVDVFNETCHGFCKSNRYDDEKKGARGAFFAQLKTNRRKMLRRAQMKIVAVAVIKKMEVLSSVDME